MAISIFFSLGASVQRIVISKIASLIYIQEAREGKFCAVHARMREYSPEIASVKCSKRNGFQW